MNNKSFHIQWHITEKCNLHCKHCYREPHRQELNFDTLKLLADRILQFVKRLGYDELTIALTGGEPFLKPEVYDLAEYISSSEVVKSISFITNGTIIPNERIKNIRKLSKIYISIEADVEEINDKIRGKGSFKKVIHNLPYFAKNYSTGIMTTLLNTNIDYLTNNLVKFLSTYFNYGISEIIFERFIPAGEAKKVKDEVVNVDKILKFYKVVAELAGVNFDTIKFYPALKVIHKTNFKFSSDYLDVRVAECVVGKDGFAVLCDGTIYPCRRFELPIGNILAEPQFDIGQLKKVKNLISQSQQVLNHYKCFALEFALT